MFLNLQGSAPHCTDESVALTENRFFIMGQSQLAFQLERSSKL